MFSFPDGQMNFCRKMLKEESSNKVQMLYFNIIPFFFYFVLYRNKKYDIKYNGIQ